MYEIIQQLTIKHGNSASFLLIGGFLFLDVKICVLLCTWQFYNACIINSSAYCNISWMFHKYHNVHLNHKCKHMHKYPTCKTSTCIIKWNTKLKYLHNEKQSVFVKVNKSMMQEKIVF